MTQKESEFDSVSFMIDLLLELRKTHSVEIRKIDGYLRVISKKHKIDIVFDKGDVKIDTNKTKTH